jgi:hypothetical protein
LEVRYVRNTTIKPSMLTDDILIEESGAYHKDLVDVMFTQAAFTLGAEMKGTALAQKLSELDENSNHRFKPEELLDLGSSIKFDKQIVPFPITVNTHTHTETVAASSGARHAHATNDFHYSVAVYYVKQNRLLHADSLGYASHEWVVRNELAQWIFHLDGSLLRLRNIPRFRARSKVAL